VSPPHQIHVLLRHRPPSISRRHPWGATPSGCMLGHRRRVPVAVPMSLGVTQSSARSKAWRAMRRAVPELRAGVSVHSCPGRPGHRRHAGVGPHPPRTGAAIYAAAMRRDDEEKERLRRLSDGGFVTSDHSAGAAPTERVRNVDDASRSTSGV
jgi:hypothetical protein